MEALNTSNKKDGLTPRLINRILLFGSAFGAAGGIVRGLQLLDFDEKNLPKTAGGLHTVLWCVLAAELLFSVAAGLLVRKKSVPGRSGRGGLAETLFPSVAMVIFALCAAVRLCMSYKPFSVWGIILSLVCFALAAAVPVAVRTLGKKKPSESEKLISLLPVGAMVVMIIELYRSVAKTPTAAFYAADVFAVIMLILLFFAVAGDINGRTGPKRTFIFGFASVQIGMTAFVGRVIRVGGSLLAGEGLSVVISSEVFEGLLALGGVFFAYAAANAVGRRGGRKPESENTETVSDAE